MALGDFYESPAKAYNEKRVIKGLEIVFKCIDKEMKVHARQETHPHVKYPDCNWVNIFSGTNYLKILSTNINHFGWYNVVEYIKIHDEALEIALIGYDLAREGKTEEAKDYLNRALFYNAYADHFLTDAFSAGHVRVPRKQIKDWAKKNIRGAMRSFVGDSLGNLLHEFDGNNRRGDHVGLPVRNSLGQEWITHSDNHMHSNANANDPVIKIPTEAVSLSVQEILRAYYSGIKPFAVFDALYLVPFVNDTPLAKKFELSGTQRENDKFLKRLRNDLAWPLRMITSKRSIKLMINNLDGIMDDMASDIRVDLREKGMLQLRMPEPYKQNFANVD